MGALFLPEMEVSENEAEIFGLQVRHEWKLIGTVYIFGDSLSNMLETINDEAPIYTEKGETKGYLRYSIIPTMFDEEGHEIPLIEYEDVNALMGWTLTVKFTLHGAKGIPDQLCEEVYAEYIWIDESQNTYRTECTLPGVRTKNPEWNYKASHDLYLSNFVVNQLSDCSITVNIWGRMPQERM